MSRCPFDFFPPQLFIRSDSFTLRGGGGGGGCRQGPKEVQCPVECEVVWVSGSGGSCKRSAPVPKRERLER